MYEGSNALPPAHPPNVTFLLKYTLAPSTPQPFAISLDCVLIFVRLYDFYLVKRKKWGSRRHLLPHSSFGWIEEEGGGKGRDCIWLPKHIIYIWGASGGWKQEKHCLDCKAIGITIHQTAILLLLISVCLAKNFLLLQVSRALFSDKWEWSSIALLFEGISGHHRGPWSPTRTIIIWAHRRGRRKNHQKLSSNVHQASFWYFECWVRDEGWNSGSRDYKWERWREEEASKERPYESIWKWKEACEKRL